MLRDVSVPLIGFALTALALPVQAQQASADSATLAAAVQTLRSDLRYYLTAQEAFYADHNTYAATAQATAQATNFAPNQSVTVVVLTSSDRGHSAVAIHSVVPGIVCGIWVGAEPAPPLRDGASEGRPTCRIPDPTPM